MGSLALGLLSPFTWKQKARDNWGGVHMGLRVRQQRLFESARESSAQRGVSSTNSLERGSCGGFIRPPQPHTFTT